MFKRISLSLLAVGVISLVVSAASLALFNAVSTDAVNTFTAGTVTLGEPSTSIGNVTDIAPGDSGSYTYEVEYTGSLEAWLSLTTWVYGDLKTCDNGGHFTVDISDGTNTYSANGGNQLLGKFNQGETVTLTVNWGLDRAAGNDCQGDSAQIHLTVVAVQARNNTNNAGTGPDSWN